MYEGTALEFVTFLTSITSIQDKLYALKNTVLVLYGRMQLHPGHQSGSFRHCAQKRVRPEGAGVVLPYTCICSGATSDFNVLRVKGLTN
jgi:hypothetical protein